MKVSCSVSLEYSILEIVEKKVIRDKNIYKDRSKYIESLVKADLKKDKDYKNLIKD